MVKKLVHARISNPVLVRKTLLESAIIATEILKSYQNLRKIRIQKKHLTTKIRTTLKETKELLLKLETIELPKLPEVKKPKTSTRVKKELKEEEMKRKEQEELLKSEFTSELDSDIQKLQEKIRNL